MDAREVGFVPYSLGSPKCLNVAEHQAFSTSLDHSDGALHHTIDAGDLETIRFEASHLPEDVDEFREVRLREFDGKRSSCAKSDWRHWSRLWLNCRNS